MCGDLVLFVVFFGEGVGVVSLGVVDFFLGDVAVLVIGDVGFFEEFFLVVLGVGFLDHLGFVEVGWDLVVGDGGGGLVVGCSVGGGDCDGVVVGVVCGGLLVGDGVVVSGGFLGDEVSVLVVGVVVGFSVGVFFFEEVVFSVLGVLSFDGVGLGSFFCCSLFSGKVSF